MKTREERFRRLSRALFLSLFAALWTNGASGVDLNVAGVDLRLTAFGTAGYAQSNSQIRYLRYINEDGTLKADSLAGVQAEAQFSTRWSATFQAVAGAPEDRDDGVEGTVRWAFVSFRPTNAWLLRAGRLRPPVFLNTQNAEVGVTYDQARLPQEVYTLTPTFDFDGASVTYTWALQSAEVNADVYWGKSDTFFRVFERTPGQPSFIPIELESVGLVLSYAKQSLLLRGGAHHIEVKRRDGQTFVNTFVPTTIPLAPPLGGTLWVPSGSPTEVEGTVLTLGADWRYADWRLTGEYARRDVRKTEIGTNTDAGYVTVARQIGKWTPYLTQARLLSKSEQRNLYQSVNSTPVPLAAGLPASYHKDLAGRIAVFDQYSTMVGTSYSFSATSKLKLEWMRTKVGVTSFLFDGEISEQSVNVYSISYSVAF